MRKRFKSEVDDRLDKVINRNVPRSRSKIQDWIREGRIRVEDDIVTSKSHPVKSGQQLELDVPEDKLRKSKIKPEPGELDVIHEDSSLLVLNKSAGIVVHPAPGNQTGTLANHLLHHYPDLSSVTDPYRAGLVHRLDRGTSGVILVARSPQAYQHLKQQFQNRTVKKQYRAILTGKLEDESLQIEVPIGKHPTNPSLRKAQSTGRYAETYVEVDTCTDEASTVYCWPKTGRTHQIRVHSLYINHPVVGDEQYGGKQASRMMLHAESIQFDHPETEQEVEFQASLPLEVEETWNDISRFA
ncbi:MAG: RluA family pseudouridine synthase [bacterium]